jgi:hypothetical protein
MDSYMYYPTLGDSDGAPLNDTKHKRQTQHALCSFMSTTRGEPEVQGRGFVVTVAKNNKKRGGLSVCLPPGTPCKRDVEAGANRTNG